VSSVLPSTRCAIVVSPRSWRGKCRAGAKRHRLISLMLAPPPARADGAARTHLAPKVPPETVRTPVVGSGRRYPLCGETELHGRQTACSATCRRKRTRHRGPAARDARDREIRALLETVLKKLQERP
jgi:hypothetical protein